MFRKATETLKALNGLVSDLGPAINLLERMSSDQATEKAIQGILDHLPEFGRLARYLPRPKNSSLESALCPDQIRAVVIEGLRQLNESIETQVYASRLLAIQRFNSQLWRRVLSRDSRISADAVSQITSNIPPMPALDPGLLEYLQRQLQLAIVWLPDPWQINDQMMSVEVTASVNSPALGCRFKAVPDQTTPGWYAVEKTAPCHFGRCDRDSLARVLEFKSRSTSWDNLWGNWLPGIATFFNLPPDSITIPSAEELGLLFDLAWDSEHTPHQAALNMLSEYSCSWWFSDSNLEICRNDVAAFDTRNPGRVPSSFRLVVGGNPERFQESLPRKTYYYADLDKEDNCGFRIMIDLHMCEGVRFNPEAYPLFYMYE